MLRNYCSGKPNCWTRNLSLVECAYSFAPHTSTGQCTSVLTCRYLPPHPMHQGLHLTVDNSPAASMHAALNDARIRWLWFSQNTQNMQMSPENMDNFRNMILCCWRFAEILLRKCRGYNPLGFDLRKSYENIDLLHTKWMSVPLRKFFMSFMRDISIQFTLIHPWMIFTGCTAPLPQASQALEPMVPSQDQKICDEMFVAISLPILDKKLLERMLSTFFSLLAKLYMKIHGSLVLISYCNVRLQFNSTKVSCTTGSEVILLPWTL